MDNTTGSINYICNPDRYSLQYKSPLYVNVIEKNQCTSLFTTDQSGGMRNGDQTVFNARCTSGITIYNPTTATICHCGYSELDGVQTYNVETPSKIEQHIQLSKGAHFYMLNKPIIACKNSYIMQYTNIQCDIESELFFLDVWCSGRYYMPHNSDVRREHAKFFKAQNTTKIFVGSKLQYLERWTLNKTGLLSSMYHNHAVWYSIVAHGKKTKSILKDIYKILPGICQKGILSNNIDVVRGMASSPKMLLEDVQKNIMLMIYNINNLDS